MTLQLYAHPFSSYCQKVLTALYENDTPFEWRLLMFGNENEVAAKFTELWPLRRMPVLVDGERAIKESSVIIEYLGLYHPGPVRLIPDDAKAALETRFMDRVFDDYVMTPMQKIVFDFIRPVEDRDPPGVSDAKALLDRSYAWLDGVLQDREWAAGVDFTLADCAAGASLFYADWVHPIPEQYAALRGYRARLLARPSFARAVDEARPYRKFFPPGAPDRD
jgi:glutathione S-transferase